MLTVDSSHWELVAPMGIPHATVSKCTNSLSHPTMHCTAPPLSAARDEGAAGGHAHGGGGGDAALAQVQAHELAQQVALVGGEGDTQLAGHGLGEVTCRR